MFTKYDTFLLIHIFRTNLSIFFLRKILTLDQPKKKPHRIFFLFTHFSKHLYQIIYFTLHFIKISNLIDFYDCFYFITYNNHHSLSLFIFKISKINKKKIKCKMNTVKCKFI